MIELLVASPADDDRALGALVELLEEARDQLPTLRLVRDAKMAAVEVEEEL